MPAVAAAPSAVAAPPLVGGGVDAKWQRFADWLHCVCVVTFDLELGQAMEVVYPPHAHLAESERTNICYLAFPDSNSGCMGDTQFHVRLRVAPPATRLSAAHRRFNASCPPAQSADAGHYWGFVYFRQIKDARLPRGYFQKSLVLLTRLPFVHLYRQLVAVLAPIYFDDRSPHSGAAVLEAACNHICQWPRLAAGTQLTLHLLGTVFRTQIPCALSPAAQLLNAAADADNANGGDADDAAQLAASVVVQPPQLLSSVQDVDLFQSLGCVLAHVHLLWELVLTAEPIVVMATSPADCSAMVQALTR